VRAGSTKMCMGSFGFLVTVLDVKPSELNSEKSTPETLKVKARLNFFLFVAIEG
jgi:hypothetical protein